MADYVAPEFAHLPKPEDISPDDQFTITLNTGSPESGASAYTFDNYQDDASTTAIYPDSGTGSDKAINYAIVAAAGEAGEIANKWKKVLRGDYDSADIRDTILGEVRGVLWYLARICTEYNTSLGEQAYTNIIELTDRQRRGVIRGSGDNR